MLLIFSHQNDTNGDRLVDIFRVKINATTSDCNYNEWSGAVAEKLKGVVNLNLYEHLGLFLPFVYACPSGLGVQGPSCLSSICTFWINVLAGMQTSASDFKIYFLFPCSRVCHCSWDWTQLWIWSRQSWYAVCTRYVNVIIIILI